MKIEENNNYPVTRNNNNGNNVDLSNGSNQKNTQYILSQFNNGLKYNRKNIIQKQQIYYTNTSHHQAGASTIQDNKPTIFWKEQQFRKLTFMASSISPVTGRKGGSNK